MAVPGCSPPGWLMSHPASLQDLLKAHQTINSQHFLSLLCSSALISVRAASRCCGNHLLGDSVWIYSVNQNASLLDRFLIPNKWQGYLIYAPWCLENDHSISFIILPLICVSRICSKDLSLSEVHLSWKKSSRMTALSSPFCSLSVA